jgi:hypothetical protein
MGHRSPWPEHVLVAAMLKRIEALGDAWDPSDPKVWSMHRALLAEAGWTEADAVDAMVRHFQKMGAR